MTRVYSIVKQDDTFDTSTKESCRLKTVQRYILSFLLIAMICIAALAGGAHVLYGDYSRSQIEEKYIARWSAAQTQADRLLETMLQYQNELSYRLMLSYTAPRMHISDTDILALLSNFEVNAELPASPMLFMRSAPRQVYTASGVIDYTAFEADMREKGVDPERTKLYSHLLTTRKPLLYSASPNSNTLMLLLPLGNAFSAYPATLMLVMDVSVISQHFEDIVVSNGTSLYAMDGLGKLALSCPAAGEEPLSWQTLYDATASGISRRMVEGRELIFLRQASSTGLITYIGVVPEEQFYAGWYTLQNQLNTVILLVVIFAILLSLVLGWMTYRPVRQAYRQITGLPAGGENELATIVDVFERQRENVSELEIRQEASLGLIRRQFMLSLINSSIKSAQEVETYRVGLNMALQRPWWISLFLSIPEETAIPARIDELLNALEGCTLQDAEMLFAECRWEQGLGLVLNFDTDTVPEDAVVRLAHQLYTVLRGHMAEPLVLGAGSVETDPLAMGASFYRATATVKAAQQQGGHGAFFWQEESGAASRLVLDTALLAEGVTYGNADVALGALQELMLRIRSSHERMPLVHLMCSDILNTVIRYAQKQNLSLDKSSLCAAAEFRSVTEFEERMMGVITELCAQSSRMRVQDTTQSRSKVITFIAANYKRNDLSLKLLSDEMNMSMSKINMLLKENLGCSFVQYVSLLRLNEVKRLLRETDDSIQSIVQSVGYIDVSSFMRKFKQMEGMAPGQYRAMHRR